MNLIAIIDYGVGNLGSVQKAMQFVGLNVSITSDINEIRRADAVVLPGVGAYSDAMKHLVSRGMDVAVKEAVQQNKLFLGICLGMQLLFETSEEGGMNVQGLGLYKGAIKLLPQNNGLKVPHIGWNSLQCCKSQLFKGLPEHPFVYFVHSFYLEAGSRPIVAATCEYGICFDAAIQSDRIFATQFHPEKSGEIGLEILKNWASMI